jgi:hypothetical protein
MCVKRMVPTARVELARLAPLPPQDSVSTNSTTSAINRLLNRWVDFGKAFYMILPEIANHFYRCKFLQGFEGVVSLDVVGASLLASGCVCSCGTSLVLLVFCAPGTSDVTSSILGADSSITLFGSMR